MQSVRRSLALSFAEKYSSLAIGFVSTVILARLLTPSEIGVYSVGVAVVGLAQALRDFGIGNYLIQEKDLTRERIRAVMGVALVVAWSIAGLLYALSGPVARFYDEPGVGAVIEVLCLSLLLIPFNLPVLALLRRNMAFGALYIVQTLSALVGAATSISLAAGGAGFMSLAWGSVAGMVMTTLAVAVMRPRDARVLPGIKKWRAVVRFGGMASATTVLSQLATAAPDFILGRLIGFEAVGLYSRAMGIIQLFNRTVMQAVMPVMTPVFAAKSRAGEEILEPYLRGLSYTTVLAWPFFAFAGLMAFPIIRILFGDQWDAAVPLVQLLCLAGIFRPLFYFTSPVFIGLGRIELDLKVALLANPISVALVLAAAFHSLEAVASVPAVFCFVYFCLSFRYIRDLIGLSLYGIVLATYRSALVAAVTSIPPALVVMLDGLQASNLWIPLLTAVAGSGVSWLAIVYVTKHPARDEITSIGKRARLMILSAT